MEQTYPDHICTPDRHGQDHVRPTDRKGHTLGKSYVARLIGPPCRCELFRGLHHRGPRTRLRNRVYCTNSLVTTTHTRFLVVEIRSCVIFAADRLGGRIFTHEESRSHHHPSPHSSCEEGVTTATNACGGVPSRPLELGAQWLHGTVGNPLFDFCVEEGIFDSQEGRIELAMAKRAYAARDVQARRPDGTQVSRREFVRHSEAWSQAVLEAETLYAASLAAEAETAAEGGNAEDQQQQQRQNLDPKRLEAAATITVPNSPRQDPHVKGISDNVNNGGSTPNVVMSADSRREDRVGAFLHLRVREILRAGGGSSGGCGIDEDILGYLVRKQHAVEGCDDLDVVSVAGYGMYEELEGGDVRVPGGFSRVVEALAAKISPERIRLQSPVTRVQWASQGQQEERRESPFAESHPCVVEYTTRRHSSGGIDVGGEQDHSDLVSTMRIRCRRVLVTVGLGVLKDGTALTFSPPLPQAKLAAIRRVGFGTADKFFVR
ncbi:similar to peroxisomal n1-acetyl-spermine/spermidine oxidase [Ectocarpus siliculosus]|uniref:Similar to peroxisomal n1-acetyl-spermine/spermidine oxidase n=1 Tax=Ectocarpus siliculosus TaxID=2880 RepID=D7G835_ECTSI|nr:similar to peroxisomal n1-acetyl-spermine/spermidine oxidase [Ectocarpus siliculosus]|eukprot:CBJ34018.1 similar to peroxisomal n1-acetyl-spermine/spermidine oxidase [Ectocarpus siliculosus]